MKRRRSRLYRTTSGTSEGRSIGDIVMNPLRAIALFATLLCLSACTRRSSQDRPYSHPIVYIDSQGFRLYCDGKIIGSREEIGGLIASRKPSRIGLEYSRGTTTSNLIDALTYFAGLGIGEYDLIAKSGTNYPFFLPGIADAGALDSVARNNRMTYLFEEIVGGRQIVPEGSLTSCFQSTL